jgi:cholesterol oxidase
MHLEKSYDYIIIGSGFGGSVSALRLAEKGYSVLVIEKGKKYSHEDFPKTNWNVRKWFWFPGIKLFGIQKLTFFRHITILSGVGVGGGSLVYANTLPRPKTAFFTHGSWAGLEKWETELEPFYGTAQSMLGAAVNPMLAASDMALQKLAEQAGRADHFSATTVGVFFGEPDITVNDPYFGGKGPDRKGCIHCGACMTGCRQNAKNSLDKNYLHLAQELGVTVIPEHRVTGVKPIGDRGEEGYEVTFRQSTKYFSEKKRIRTKGLIFSGGVLGTVPLLVRLKKTTLPALSPRVGDMIRSNNEALIVNTSLSRNPEFHKGLAIGSILELDENSHLEPVRYGEGSGFWRTTMMPMVSEPVFFKRILKLFVLLVKNPVDWLRILFIRDYGKSSSVLLFMQHLDSTLKLKKGFFGTVSRVEKGKAPTPFMPEAHAVAQAYSKIINARPQVIATETITGIPSTAHILGGACMGKTRDEGVIDSNNSVFGYENMFVFDGSMISANPGVNPSLTITAISERGMSKIPVKK